MCLFDILNWIITEKHDLPTHLTFNFENINSKEPSAYNRKQHKTAQELVKTMVPKIE